MDPQIRNKEQIKLIGKSLMTSFTNDKTEDLWKSFGPFIKNIRNRVGQELYSVDIYNDPGFFAKFDPMKEFEKWAAVEVSDFNDVPDGMDTLLIPDGRYAVFHYKGKPSEAGPVFQFIFGEWLPHSKYEMDNRPYFARMGEKYKGEDPESEEEFWVPVREK
ncbi:MAG TPA: GyrI-like domain-containing protein [Bacteroidales bacterium]|nr:GyrI-like domain-containing protein [Bacteroidales bacterium]HRX97327.1 GyrI-like domain-containing protein [Bacteroidales bacterium]